MAERVDTSALEGGLDADRGWNVIACCVIFVVACTFFLGLRFIAAHVGRNRIFWEDWLMLPAWALLMGMCAAAIWSVEAGGVGRHQAWVLKNNPKTMVSWAQALFITEFTYGILIPLEKTTILLLYLRIFSPYKWFRYATYGMMAYIWMWGISESIVAVVQCHPVEYQWTRKGDGHCIDQLAYYRWVSVPNVIHDVFMLTAPLPMVWKLQIAMKQKMALIGIFVIGSIGCVASFIRMYNFFVLDALSDRTWASIQLMSWTIAEPGVILICACLPSLWPLLRRIPGFRSIVGKSSASRSGTGHMNSSSRALGSTSWAGHGQDNFIPLDDMEYGNQPQKVNVVSTSTNQALERGNVPYHHHGINVTREVTVSHPR